MFVPADFVDLGERRRVYRALRCLVANGALVKLGFGVYARVVPSPIDGGPMIPVCFDDAVRRALEKLDVQFNETQVVKDYNAGLTTQVQANAVYVTLRPCTRKLSYDGMNAVFHRMKSVNAS